MRLEALFKVFSDGESFTASNCGYRNMQSLKVQTFHMTRESNPFFSVTETSRNLEDFSEGFPAVRIQ